MKIILVAAIWLSLFVGVIYGFRFVMTELKTMYAHPKKRMSDEHNYRSQLAAVLARTDQLIAEAESMAAELLDDEPDRARVEFCLSQLRLDRADVEGKLRAAR